MADKVNAVGFKVVDERPVLNVEVRGYGSIASTMYQVGNNYVITGSYSRGWTLADATYWTSASSAGSVLVQWAGGSTNIAIPGPDSFPTWVAVDYNGFHSQNVNCVGNFTCDLTPATNTKTAALQFANKTPLPLHVIFYPDGVNGSMTPATCDIPAASDMYSQTTGSISYSNPGPLGLVNGHVQVYAGNQLVTDMDIPWVTIAGGQGLAYSEQIGGGDYGMNLWNDAGIPAGNLTQNYGGAANNNLPFGTAPANSAVQGQLVNALQSSAVGSVNGAAAGVLGNPTAPTSTTGPTTTTTIQNGQTNTVVSSSTGPMSSGILGPGDEALIHRAVASAIASNLAGSAGDGFLTNGTVSTAHGYAGYFTNGLTPGFGTNAQVIALTGQVAATQSALSGSMSNAPSFMSWLIPQWPAINNDPVWTCSAGDYSMEINFQDWWCVGALRLLMAGVLWVGVLFSAIKIVRKAIA